jgi:8-hydroxy-5-deazaflavin:NADPH oxidoreductase
MNHAIIGSGAIGHALASQFARSDTAVSIANRRGPDSMADLARELGPRIRPVSVTEALRADVVFLAVPFDAVPEVVNATVAWDGRIVVDATNAIAFPAFEPADLGGRLSTEIVAAAVRGARVVKAFNTLPAALLAAVAARDGGRRVVFVSGDDAAAKSTVIELIDRLGFAAVDLGMVAEGGRLQQFGGPLVALDLVQFGGRPHRRSAP